MVNITFKNVGQGDSILIEWTEEGEDKIGIIDCNQINSSTNPVLEHIIKSNVKEIEFLLLSHPHKDHYSGLYSLISYCDNNQIIIKKFLHTGLSTIDYWIAASRSLTEQKKILNLYKLIMQMRDDGKLSIYAIDDNPDTQKSLSNHFKLEFLAPSSIELENYIRQINFPFDEEDSTSNPNGNWLCTIIKIYNNTTSVILTSDVESAVLKRLNKKGGRLKTQKSILVQVPHHGSAKNLDKSFWTGLSKYSNTFAVISVGKNGYKHPSEEAVDFFNNHPNYTLERTDLSVAASVTAKNNSAMLNIVSKKTSQSIANAIGQLSSQDLKFQITDKECIKI